MAKSQRSGVRTHDPWNGRRPLLLTKVFTVVDIAIREPHHYKSIIKQENVDHCHICFIYKLVYQPLFFKDASSVDWYPYNWWQFCNMLSIPKWFNIAKGMTKHSWQIMCCAQKSKATSTTKHKIKHKNPCQSRRSNPLAPKADALPLDHQTNWKHRLLSSNLTVSTQWVEI